MPVFQSADFGSDYLYVHIPSPERSDHLFYKLAGKHKKANSCRFLQEWVLFRAVPSFRIYVKRYALNIPSLVASACLYFCLLVLVPDTCAPTTRHLFLGALATVKRKCSSRGIQGGEFGFGRAGKAKKGSKLRKSLCGQMATSTMRVCRGCSRRAIQVPR